MQGCLNPNAINYNPLATEDDHSCQYVLTGKGGATYLFSDYKELRRTSFTLSYSIEGNAWVFFHDYLPDFYFHTREQLWTLKGNGIYKHNAGKPGVYYDGEPKPFFIDVVFKSDSDLLLETVQWITENLKDSIDLSGNDQEWDTFTHISIWNSQQHSGRIALRDLPAPDQPYRKTQGEWTFNDFRNVLGTRGVQFLLDIFYDYALDTTQTADKGFYDQEMLEDKYFVVRFEFDNQSGNQMLLHQTNIQAIKSDR